MQLETRKAIIILPKTFGSNLSRIEKYQTMEEIKQLLAITQKLKDKYIHLNKQFSLDGKLVGDIGEVLAAEKYGLRLLEENAPVHDAEEISTGRMVQIKSSFKGFCYFPFGNDRIPEYFLSIAIDVEGNISEIYNGPGKFVVDEYIRKTNKKPYKNSYYTLSKGKLMVLNGRVKEKDRIQILEAKKSK